MPYKINYQLTDHYPLLINISKSIKDATEHETFKTIFRILETK